MTQVPVPTATSFPVISTKRSAWRDLINAPFGASGKPQRCLDYARHDRKDRRSLRQAKRQSRALDYARDDRLSLEIKINRDLFGSLLVFSYLCSVRMKVLAIRAESREGRTISPPPILKSPSGGFICYMQT